MRPASHDIALAAFSGLGASVFGYLGHLGVIVSPVFGAVVGTAIGLLFLTVFRDQKTTKMPERTRQRGGFNASPYIRFFEIVCGLVGLVLLYNFLNNLLPINPKDTTGLVRFFLLLLLSSFGYVFASFAAVIVGLTTCKIFGWDHDL